ncbi:OHCU decarboxylase [Frondihabitans sucicola]|uniref:2-oxo-4-hydroxy-4-carboxy-5-ureidoimidazoline decarboxylase n=1 Tax=Frondihabitans sucicola TaxID=1268041 RepID=A0ABM8GJ53_9MICO|nr:2-oxo-4-hydroxy-4-carboxy-5-ureidoimidazoline decarboxylase [Frondihabitans sucicola]BDZ48408.1 OHCU decarboxylase [Frondihabitans sucicola]
MIDVSESDLRAALHVERWVAEVAAGSPYDDWEALRAASGAAATPLSPAEIDEALASHPRIGEKPTGADAAAEFSRAEQQAPDVDDQHLAKALAEGNATYEERFDRVFLIRAAGRTRAEIVEELDRRLKLDDETELAIVGDELRDIALLRLEKTYGAA